MKTQSFGEKLKQYRLGLELTLREFCKKFDFDPALVSRYERGVFPPPQKPEILERFANAFGLTRGSVEWNEFFDVASVGRGEIPTDILSDEEVVKKLPILFRTLRGTPLAEDKQDALIERMRKRE